MSHASAAVRIPEPAAVHPRAERPAAPKAAKPVPPTPPPPTPDEQHVAGVLAELKNGAQQFEYEVRGALAFAELLSEADDRRLSAFAGQQIVMLRHFVNYALLFDDCARELADSNAD